MRAKDALGRQGEELAVKYLRAQGLTVLARNWRCARGELDVVAQEGSTLVVCEVKTRRTTAYGAPVEAVTRWKLRRIRQLALLWLDEQQVYMPTIRFDVVGIVQPLEGPPSITHLRGVE